MKKAFAWLAAHGIEYDFRDYKAQGIDEPTLRRWLTQVGWDILLNRAGTTFRKLPEAAKQGIDAEKALRLMLAQPSMIKRPVLEHGKTLLVGFSPEKYGVLAAQR